MSAGTSHLDLEERIARCGREQDDIRAMGDDRPAWLTTLGHEDWEMEKRLIISGDANDAF